MTEPVPRLSPNAAAGPQARGLWGRFGVQLGAHGWRELLQTVFLIALARHGALTYGRFMLALSVGQIVLLVAEFGLNPHLVLRLARRPADEAPLVRQVSFVKMLLLSLSGLAAWGLVAAQAYDVELNRLILLLASGIALEALASTGFAVCQVRGRQALESRIRAAAATAGFGYGLAALALGAPPAWVAAYKAVETAVLIAGCLATVGRSWGRRTVQTPAGGLAAVVRGSAVFAAIEIAAILYNKLNLFFMERWGGEQIVAQYSATWQIVDGVTNLVCGLLLTRTLFPVLAGLAPGNEAAATALARRVTHGLLACAAVLLLALGAGSGWIIRLVYGPEYAAAAELQRWLVAAIAIGFLHNVAASLMISLGRAGLVLAFCASGLVVNLALCVWLIPDHPAGGGVASLLIAKALVACGTVGYAQWRLGLIFGRGRPAAPPGGGRG